MNSLGQRKRIRDHLDQFHSTKIWRQVLVQQRLKIRFSNSYSVLCSMCFSWAIVSMLMLQAFLKSIVELQRGKGLGQAINR